MEPESQVSRRGFLAAWAVGLGAAALPEVHQARGGPEETLALDGGPKAVPGPLPRLVRWGEPEAERLHAMLGQDSLFYWKGPQTALLTERFRQICPLEHVMTCSSGTAAVHAAVAAAGVGPGDEVITSPVTDIGTVVGVLYQQGVPVFADLVADTYNLDPEDVARKITPRTKAIIAVHLGGNPCDLKALKGLADRHKLVLIEDCAQAWGALYGGKPVGTVGHVACFSLQDSKLVTCGDGGVVASSDGTIGPLLQRFADKGFDRLGKSGLFSSFATNYRMSEPQAAVAAAQLGRLEGIASRRAALGALLAEGVAGAPGVRPHGVRPGDRCTYWFAMMRLKPGALRCDRAAFVQALAAEGVPASAGYIPVPLYGNPVFREHGFFAGRWPVKEFGLTSMDYAQVCCPEAEAILATGFRVVIHQAMSDDYVRSLGAAVRKVATHYAA